MCLSQRAYQFNHHASMWGCKLDYSSAIYIFRVRNIFLEGISTLLAQRKYNAHFTKVLNDTCTFEREFLSELQL